MTFADVIIQRLQIRKKYNDARTKAGLPSVYASNVSKRPTVSDELTKRVTDNNATLKTAVRNGMPWTYAEEVLIMTSTLKNKALALTMGRTMRSVGCRREILRSEVRAGLRVF